MSLVDFAGVVSHVCAPTVVCVEKNNVETRQWQLSVSSMNLVLHVHWTNADPKIDCEHNMKHSMRFGDPPTTQFSRVESGSFSLVIACVPLTLPVGNSQAQCHCIVLLIVPCALPPPCTDSSHTSNRETTLQDS